MKSYVYESVKLSNGGRLVTRYTPEERLALSIVKLFLYLLLVWPVQLFIWWPIKILFKVILILCEMILRAILWLIKLPFCRLFYKSYPNF